MKIEAILLAAAVAAVAASPAGAQVARDSTPNARLTLTVLHDSLPLRGALVRVAGASAQTDVRGQATLTVAAGRHTVVATRIGYRPDSLIVSLGSGANTTITITLAATNAEIAPIVVSATRSERRVEDVPLRVEVIDEEEVAEKVEMTPGDIAMMLNETSGLRVQTTNPSLGGASVRIQGLVGRYSLLLADGLPLYGGQAGGLGLLQIPPLDLGRVEVIKGTASALYGSSALGGVINLVSRRPDEKAEHTALLNHTTRNGTDGVVFLSAPLSRAWGYTLLTGAHRQSRQDLDDDGWTDIAGYERFVARPRFYFDNGAGKSAFVTAGVTGENRTGGTIAGAVAPNGQPYAEGLVTNRADIGALARFVINDSSSSVLHGAIVTVRGSAMEQRHRHTFGAVREDDRHGTWFSEAAIAIPRQAVTFVAGTAIQQDLYRAQNVAGFNYTFTVPSAFTQMDVDPTSWLSLTTSARVDAHSEYGTTINPRISALLRKREGLFAGWNSRISFGGGEFAPTPFTEETEATGLTPLVPLGALVAERATSGSFDIGGPVETVLGQFEVNATAFGSRVQHALQVIDAPGTTVDGASRIQIVNAAEPTRTWGAELLARFTRELGEVSADGDEPPALRVTGTYTYLNATECDPDAPGGIDSCARREVPLTPRHAVGLVASIEQPERSRVGLEMYYTGRQSLDGNPYRSESRPYFVLGLLGERAFDTRIGITRLFVNLENLTNVRQTRFDPLVLPSRGRGGRWTTDAWTDLTGFTMNAGVRLGF